MQGVHVDFEGFFFLDVSEIKIMSSYPLLFSYSTYL